ncbi:MAG: 50S ribosomal protein L19 [Planctomycetota bacterium]|nr:50S ribosomal protein L19 [Planctomycetota bacterium]MDA1263410.1 50S ribosomal protein L19 [Planctomycetota bacterium]
MNRTAIMESVEAKHLKPAAEIPTLRIGDTVDVHYRIVEGDKERVQIFQGVLLSTKGRGVNRTITIRRIVANEGVERVFPLHSTRVSKVEVLRHAEVRRAKLYYLRGLTGKARRLKETRRESAETK